MSKKAKTLSKAEKFYIEQHRDTDDKELASDLNKTISLVAQYKESLPTEEETTSATVGDLMGKHDRGATIMTEEASTLIDKKKEALPTSTPSYRDNIHVIKKKSPIIREK